MFASNGGLPATSGGFNAYGMLLATFADTRPPLSAPTAEFFVFSNQEAT
jgi:hypothetical protein